MSLISVVIPCFNSAKFIGETIESVLTQEGAEFEVIIVDDGSTDNSSGVIRSFGTKVHAEFGPNRGASAARNRGTKLAKGDLIQYLDSDDVLMPQALRKRAEALSRSGADVAYSDWQRLIETDEGTFELGQVVARTVESAHPDPEVALFSEFWCPPAALLYPRGLVDCIGGWNEALPVIQDARFLLDAALHGGRFVHVDGVGALYRMHRGPSLSTRDPIAFLRDCFENAIQVEQWWRDRQRLTRARKQAVLKVLFQVARGAFEGDQLLFRRACKEICRIEPSWVPPKPWPLCALSKLLGYPQAESVALGYRELKKRFTRGLR